MAALLIDRNRPGGWKLDKSVVVYIHKQGTQYQCKDCKSFMPGSNGCAKYSQGIKVKPFGSCTEWEQGKPSDNQQPSGAFTKQETGYEDNGPGFSCKRCEYFNEDRLDCKKVNKASLGDDPGWIDPDACCNAWEKGEE